MIEGSAALKMIPTGAALVVFSLLIRIAANVLALAFLPRVSLRPRLIFDTGLSQYYDMLRFIEWEEDLDRRVFDRGERPLDLGAIL
jgi:hypothetical protein